MRGTGSPDDLLLQGAHVFIIDRRFSTRTLPTIHDKIGTELFILRRESIMPNPEAINMMVLSNDYAKIHAAAMLTAVAATYGKPIKIFVSMEALPAFHKDPAVSGTVAQGSVARKIIETGGAASFLDLFRQGKELGDVTLYACSMVLDLYHWTLDDLVDIFDNTLGVAGFLAMVEGETTFTL